MRGRNRSSEPPLLGAGDAMPDRAPQIFEMSNHTQRDCERPVDVLLFGEKFLKARSGFTLPFELGPTAMS